MPDHTFMYPKVTPRDAAQAGGSGTAASTQGNASPAPQPAQAQVSGADPR